MYDDRLHGDLNESNRIVKTENYVYVTDGVGD